MPLIEPEPAMAILAKRQRAAVAMLLFRVVLLSVLTTSLRMRIPESKSIQPMMDAVAGVLALWPFWTAVGRNWAWRIALGRSYVEAGRNADAVRVLSALDGVQGRLFDVQGEGGAVLRAAREGLR